MPATGNNLLTAENIQSVLRLYDEDGPATIEQIGSGLINHTWKVDTGRKRYVVQRVNEQVFKNPENVAHNISIVGDYLSKHATDYLFVRPVAAVNGQEMVHVAALGYFRLAPFIEGAVTHTVVSSPEQAYEAALQFARFASRLRDFDANTLQTTIPHFHDLSFRYRQFVAALKNSYPERIKKAKTLIDTLLAHDNIVQQFEDFAKNPAFKLRVMHHDTKISNVLFDEKGRGICVIDLDTIMPGYFFSDVGDMMRTYLSPVNEEEHDFSLIYIRKAFYEAITAGYLEEMGSVLSKEERTAFSFSGKFMIYMQALRFLTDYLMGDVYYGAKYEGHNLVRAGNQVGLLELYMGKR